jgi:hypothetical protein
MSYCPHCGNKLEFIAPVEMNCEIYGGSPKGVTKCCGNIVQVYRIITIKPYIPDDHGELEKDDWGNKKQSIIKEYATNI